jgi:putative membrane protein
MDAMSLIARLIINMIAIWLAAHWVSGITIDTNGHDDIGHKLLVILGIAAVFTVVNALIKPIVQLLSLPLVIVTLGLFLLIVNGLMLELTAKITETTNYGLRIDHFWGPAIWGALIIAVVNWVLGALVRERRRD